MAVLNSVSGLVGDARAFALISSARGFWVDSWRSKKICVHKFRVDEKSRCCLLGVQGHIRLSEFIEALPVRMLRDARIMHKRKLHWTTTPNNNDLLPTATRPPKKLIVVWVCWCVRDMLPNLYIAGCGIWLHENSRRMLEGFIKDKKSSAIYKTYLVVYERHVRSCGLSCIRSVLFWFTYNSWVCSSLLLNRLTISLSTFRDCEILYFFFLVVDVFVRCVSVCFFSFVSSRFFSSACDNLSTWNIENRKKCMPYFVLWLRFQIARSFHVDAGEWHCPVYQCMLIRLTHSAKWNEQWGTGKDVELCAIHVSIVVGGDVDVNVVKASLKNLTVRSVPHSRSRAFRSIHLSCQKVHVGFESNSRDFKIICFFRLSCAALVGADGMNAAWQSTDLLGKHTAWYSDTRLGRRKRSETDARHCWAQRQESMPLPLYIADGIFAANTCFRRPCSWVYLNISTP